jgi:hypothetical protein
MTDHRPLYPHHGEAYKSAMSEAQLEFDLWEQTECVQRGITIYNRNTFQGNRETDND